MHILRSQYVTSNNVVNLTILALCGKVSTFSLVLAVFLALQHCYKLKYCEPVADSDLHVVADSKSLTAILGPTLSL